MDSNGNSGFCFAFHGFSWEPNREVVSLLILYVKEKMFLGQRGNSNPASVLAALMSKRERFQEELRNIEKQVYDLETRYLQDSGQYGTALKGFEGFLSSSKNTTK
ncbi:hypothetical protein Pint_25053 [Pistacia integerrima]|nr:hypothetical protein Pint_25053 [Pistacia integerrima]